ncbi:uncharacterized protein LOC122056499 [Zingiber officinale]|uniref:NERD domain-containing protein n=1 Tax=Zingiber officinale TaxID=94328 RepID=A0A8J5H6A3_ZINOF|nr:uncharacterized protein LOC122051976 [Zingiber officinale]XP_042474409.1 uncharacterized protein LOC122056499 [Zingiber officinale]KAG6518359.1 hypothetical protein ZIOFF_021834 [Zingiber officinale]KAG6521244.1 hypothetical protein ZIOFF_018355 [Zingiber officinale]
MWVELLCGLVLYKIIRRLFDGDDAIPDVDSSDSDASFVVATRLEKIFKGKAFVGLRIPDADAGTRQHIDVVIVTKREVMVVAIRNFSGFVEVSGDGNWVCTSDKKHKPKTYPDPVIEVNRQIEVLESYLEQRGAILPKGHVIGRVILPHSNCRPSYSISSQLEVVTSDKWNELKPESASGLSNWIKGAVGKNDRTDWFEKLQFILSTSPMWDRLELKGDRNILGEFLEFKANHDDMQALRNVKRSKVGHFIVQKPSMLGLGRSRLQVLYFPRDYRSGGASSSEWKEAAVKPSTEVLFQPMNSKKAQKFKLSSIVSVTLTA